MKLKELPLSIFKTLALKNKQTTALKEGKNKTVPVIVSLTSIPYRLKKVHITIRSILNQSVSPEKIILWLHEDLKNKIPKSLKILEGNIFEIRYTHLHCSHKKLIHTLKLYPENVIVTCDDDFIYDEEWLEKLYNEHLINQKDIVGNQTRQIKYDSHGELLPYKEWISTSNPNPKTILPIGAAGILYPPNSLDKRVFSEDLFLKLCPKADDLWFKAMAILQNTNARQTKNPPRLIPIAGTQSVSLKNENIKKDYNKVQWQQLVNYFNLQY
ncbi:hypothetical protein HX109_00390 [Galbibacter sp. BG1]|uniref:glycosyltransferase n=1 Tax=Galbibacter sp. BG1 TaxID=1170699 RepID=UPI0015BE4092|nr:glycosyltransferase [Galbibacter sp. BG1]QLE00089.1 hypothetical protein HX109_00390 [Galbibacter sp. BG1]